MSAEALARSSARIGPVQTALLAGVVAAVVEMAPVLPIQDLVLHNPPVRVFQSIAFAVLGKATFEGGLASAALGAALHLAVSIVAAALFVGAALRAPILVRRWVTAGLLYGVAVYAVMNFIVVPLTRIGFHPASDWRLLATSFSIHLLFFGAPIAAVTRFASRA
jgi:hypothetical protein